MSQKIKKFFFGNLSKRKIVTIFLVLLILGLFLPSHFASAQLGWLGNLAVNTASAIAGILVQLFIVIAYLIFRLSNVILNWVISPSFISLKFTDFTANEFVKTGWTLCRDLANMGFIIALAVIGLATALRIGEYQAKKTLPILILIALLINFTPVITGLIIDAANITMNFFLAELSGARSYTALLGEHFRHISQLFKTTTFLSAGSTGFLIESSVLLLFFLGSAFIFFVFAFLFMVRYVALWILVILSPLAFFCYILPATRKVFHQWWQQFLQWSIIGIIMGFFMYLAEQMFVFIQKKGLGIGEIPPEQILGESPVPFFNTIFPYALPLILLVIGFLLSIQTAPVGAKAIMNFLTQRGQAAASWVARKGRAGARWAARETVGRAMATKWGERFMKGLGRFKLGLPETGKEWKEAGWGRRIVGGLLAPAVYPLRYALRPITSRIARAGLRYGAIPGREIDKEVNRLIEQYGTRKEDVLRAVGEFAAIPKLDYKRRIAMARYVTAAQGEEGLEMLEEFSPGATTETVKAAAKYEPGSVKQIVKYKPQLVYDKEIGAAIQKTLVPKGFEDEGVKELIRIGVEAAEAIPKAAFVKAVTALKEEDIPTLSEDTVRNSEFLENVIRFQSISFSRRLGELRRGAVERIREKYKELGPKEIAKTNPAFLRASIISPGFKMIFPPLVIEGKELTEEDVEKFRELVEKEIKEVDVEKAIREYLEKEAKKKKRREIPETGAGI